MRKTGIALIAVIAALMMVAPSISVDSDASDSWDRISSAYSLSGSEADSIYEQLTDDYGKHFCLSVFDKTGFNFLANEGNEAIGQSSSVKNISFSDGIVKSIDNKYETVTETYKEIICDLNVTVSIYDSTKTGSLTNGLYTSEDRGFTELLSFLGLSDSKTFATGDVFYLSDCHAESYMYEKTTMYYRENLAGDYYLTQTFTETTEVLKVTGATLHYQSLTSSQTKSTECSISLTGTSTETVNYDYGTVQYPVEGTEYTARTSKSSNNNGSANYSFNDSTHVANMTNPQTASSYAGVCKARSYSNITEDIAKSGPSDLYPNTLNPEDQIKSLEHKTIHTTVSDVRKDINDLEYKYGLVKDEKDMSFMKQVVYVAAIVVFIIAMIIIYMAVIRKKNA